MKYITIFVLYILGWLLAKAIIRTIDKIAETRMRNNLKRIKKMH